MAARATSAIVKRASFSSAVLPAELNEIDHDVISNRIHIDNDSFETIPPKPYSSIPGPKEWPLIGNSWRFAPIIGKECLLFKAESKRLSIKKIFFFDNQ